MNIDINSFILGFGAAFLIESGLNVLKARRDLEIAKKRGEKFKVKFDTVVKDLETKAEEAFSKIKDLDNNTKKR